MKRTKKDQNRVWKRIEKAWIEGRLKERILYSPDQILMTISETGANKSGLEFAQLDLAIYRSPIVLQSSEIPAKRGHFYIRKRGEKP